METELFQSTHEHSFSCEQKLNKKKIINNFILIYESLFFSSLWDLCVEF